MTVATTIESMNTSVNYALKEYFTKDEVNKIVYRNRPALAMTPKDPNAVGDPFVIPIIYADAHGGRSANYANAVTYKNNSQGLRFDVAWTQDYSLSDVPNLWIEASRNNVGAVVNLLTSHAEGALSSLSRSRALDLFRTGTGARGQAGTISTTLLTLSDVEDIVAFEVGQELEASANENGTSARTGNATVTAIDRSAGTMTSDSNWASQITSFAANDYIFVIGDRANSATVDKKFTGFNGWIPITAPASGDSFFGRDRSTDSTRLAGVRHSGTGQTAEEALIDGMKKANREDGLIDRVFLSHAKFADIEKLLGSRIMYDDQEVGEIGFTGIKVNAGNAKATVFADNASINTQAFGLEMDSWVIFSSGPMVKLREMSAGRFIDLEGSDAKRIVAASYGNVGCFLPGHNVNITF